MGDVNRGIERLEWLKIKNYKPKAGKKTELVPDGGGLHVRIDRLADGKYRRAYIFRYSSPTNRVIGADGNATKKGVRRDAGLGSIEKVSLVAARAIARKYRDQIALGIDPLEEIEAKASVKAAQKKVEAQAKEADKRRERHTLIRVAREYHEKYVAPNRTPKHAHQWITSIETHVPLAMQVRPIEDIAPEELLDMLLTLRRKVPETASRVGQRLGLVLAEAKFLRIIASNPMQEIAHRLRQTKRDREKAQGNFASLPFNEVHEFVKRLHWSGSMTALALEFTIRTASRTSETIGATWSEVDLAAKTWVVPKGRMKAAETHTVFLPDRCVEILKETKKLGSKYCFPSPASNKRAISNMGMLTLLRRFKINDRATVHGMRSTFATWAYQECQRSRPDLAREDVIEACLAHQEEDRVKRSYSRSKFDDDRRELLRLWSEYIDTRPPEKAA